MLKVNPPQLRSLFKNKYRAQNPFFVAKSFYIVGGLLDDNKQENLLVANDLIKVEDVVRRAYALGIDFTEEPDVQVLNKEYGHDFLKNPPYADLLFFSRVNKGVCGNSKSVGEESLRLQLGDTWEQAIGEANPAILAMSCDASCVNEEDAPSHFEQLNAGTQEGHGYPIFMNNQYPFGANL